MVPHFKDRRPRRTDSKEGEEEDEGLQLGETEGYDTERGIWKRREAERPNGVKMGKEKGNREG